MKKNILKLSLILLCLSGTTLLAKQNSVYEDVPTSEVSPKDGVWKPKIDSNNVMGCPSMMKSMIDKQNIKTESKKMTFSKPFHPASLFDEADQLKWEKIGTNKWEATLVNESAEGMKVSIKWKLGVVSETKMKVQSHISMKFPPEMVAMMGGGSAECKTVTHGTYNYMSK